VHSTSNSKYICIRKNPARPLQTPLSTIIYVLAQALFYKTPNSLRRIDPSLFVILRLATTDSLHRIGPSPVVILRLAFLSDDRQSSSNRPESICTFAHSIFYETPDSLHGIGPSLFLILRLPFRPNCLSWHEHKSRIMFGFFSTGMMSREAASDEAARP
jgi:hypothetical protein